MTSLVMFCALSLLLLLAAIGSIVYAVVAKVPDYKAAASAFVVFAAVGSFVGYDFAYPRYQGLYWKIGGSMEYNHALLDYDKAAKKLAASQKDSGILALTIATKGFVLWSFNRAKVTMDGNKYYISKESGSLAMVLPTGEGELFEICGKTETSQKSTEHCLPISKEFEISKGQLTYGRIILGQGHMIEESPLSEGVMVRPDLQDQIAFRFDSKDYAKSDLESKIEAWEEEEKVEFIK